MDVARVALHAGSGFADGGLFVADRNVAKARIDNRDIGWRCRKLSKAERGKRSHASELPHRRGPEKDQTYSAVDWFAGLVLMGKWRWDNPLVRQGCPGMPAGPLRLQYCAGMGSMH